jgi:metal-responsive CopG/Arc/MetJ family transcriptional regulator
MRVICIRVSEPVMEAIELLVRLDYYPNRSEAIRQLLFWGVTEFMKLHPDVYEKLKQINPPATR